ncbi:MAG: cupredoxin domain-containing protein [Acidobacteria bacterium]|nr:cupredoxin domain-containing protein [Acidobacteriota bacterium]
MKIISIFVLLAAIVAIGACSGAKTENKTAADPDVYVAKPGETIKVKVTTSYEPKSIKVKKGGPVKMEFTRVDDKNCGDELVFPKLNIKKTLPVGEPVLVEFTPTESGDLAFQCGMDMMRGKIVVE